MVQQERICLYIGVTGGITEASNFQTLILILCVHLTIPLIVLIILLIFSIIFIQPNLTDEPTPPVKITL